jgi:hypothetical protein
LLDQHEALTQLAHAPRRNVAGSGWSEEEPWLGPALGLPGVVWQDLRRAWWRILGPQMAVWLVAAPGIVCLLAITGDWPPEALRSCLAPGSAVMAALCC